MADREVLGIIPARWGSTRFPGKPLADLAGRPLLEHVWLRARAARSLSRVLVATDDERILRAVAAWGGEAVMTAGDHACGTDRVAEVARAVPGGIIVNIQGDEPLLDPAAVDAAVAPLLADPTLGVATLAAPLAPDRDAGDPHLVKVVVGDSGDALYFSRAAIPYRRHPGTAPATLHHVGLYAFRRQALLEFSSWPPGDLERAEGLEQLRLLARGRRIRVVTVARAFPGVDTPADLERAAAALRADLA